MLPLEIRSNMSSEMHANPLVDLETSKNSQIMPKNPIPQHYHQTTQLNQQAPRNGPSLIFDPSKILQVCSNNFKMLSNVAGLKNKETVLFSE